MAFIAFTNAEIESGDAVTQDLLNKVQDNFDDHETRILAVEGGSAVAYHSHEWSVSGDYATYTPFENCGVIRLVFGITVLAGRVLIHTAGSSGSTEIDILYKRGAGAWTSIFSTKPSVTSASGDFALSTNAVISTSALLAGDLVRMDITTTQGGSPLGLTGILEFEKS